MECIKQLHSLLAEMISFFDELVILENKKMDAISQDNIDLLEQYMKDEQASSMKLKGLELKREKIQAECGFEGLTLRDIAERLSGEDKEKISEAYLLLERRVQEVQNALSSANKCIEVNLYAIEKILNEASVRVAETGYDDKGGIKKEGTGKIEFKSKKI